MKKQIIFGKQCQNRIAMWLFGLLCMGLITGCSSIKIVRTVGLPGLPPIADVKQVDLVEHFEDVHKPYQIVGTILRYRKTQQLHNTSPAVSLFRSKRSKYKELIAIAAAMGGDGVIGIRENPGPSHPCFSGLRETYFETALVVKWLKPGEQQQSIPKPFAVSMLPLAEDPGARGNQADIAQALADGAVLPLAKNGYYLLPLDATGYKGGIEGSKTLSDAELHAVGGEYAHFLLEIGFSSRAEVAAGLFGSRTEFNITSTLMEKNTRQLRHQGSGSAYAQVGWLVNLEPNRKRIAAGYLASQSSFGLLKPIHEEASR